MVHFKEESDYIEVSWYYICEAITYYSMSPICFGSYMDKIILLWWPWRQFLTASIPQHKGERRNAPWSCWGDTACIESLKCRGRKKFVALKREVVSIPYVKLFLQFNVILFGFLMLTCLFMLICISLFRFCLIPLGSSLLKISWVPSDIIQPISCTLAQLSKFYPVIRAHISSQSQIYLYLFLTIAICFSFWTTAFVSWSHHSDEPINHTETKRRGLFFCA